MNETCQAEVFLERWRALYRREVAQILAAWGLKCGHTRVAVGKAYQFKVRAGKP